MITLEARMTGLRVKSIVQKVEAFCDDVSLMTENLDDFIVIEEVVRKFEKPSGAILSRNRKCTVLGIGSWQDKINWPIHWIKTVKNVKVFGVFISNSYQEMLNLNWDHRFKKFSDALYAWKQRILDSIYQRVEVIRIFALSRVYYVSAVLPIGRVMVKKFEKLMGKFIWNFTGKILRVSMNDIKN